MEYTRLRLEDLLTSDTQRARFHQFIHQALFIARHQHVHAPMEVIVLRGGPDLDPTFHGRFLIKKVLEYSDVFLDRKHAGISVPALLARGAADGITAATFDALEPGFAFEVADADDYWARIMKATDAPVAIQRDIWAEVWVAG
jgi:hypothetical protein